MKYLAHWSCTRARTIFVGKMCVFYNHNLNDNDTIKILAAICHQIVISVVPYIPELVTCTSCVTVAAFNNGSQETHLNCKKSRISISPHNINFSSRFDWLTPASLSLNRYRFSPGFHWFYPLSISPYEISISPQFYRYPLKSHDFPQTNF